MEVENPRANAKRILKIRQKIRIGLSRVWYSVLKGFTRKKIRMDRISMYVFSKAKISETAFLT